MDRKCRYIVKHKSSRTTALLNQPHNNVNHIYGNNMGSKLILSLGIQCSHLSTYLVLRSQNGSTSMYSVLRIYEVVIDGIGYSNDGIMGMMHT